MQAAKQNPGTINVAISSSMARVVFELLQNKSQAKLFPVAYKASNSALSDVLAIILTLRSTP